jgi:hypothetical protein
VQSHLILRLAFVSLLVSLFGGLLLAQDAPYRQVKITLTNQHQYQQLAADGLIFDHVHAERMPQGGWQIETILDNSEYAILQQSGLPHQIVEADVQAAIAARPGLTASEKKALQQKYGVTGFEFGSMGGYYTYLEVVAELDSMRFLYPNLVSEKFSIGQTVQGRDIWAVKISDNPDIDEEEPEVLYDALHHCREPQGMMTLFYFMYYLLENYDSNPEAAYLINERELYFIPVMNPDGYTYNQSINPNGGGMWRKNRRNNGDGTFGVDLNRNYGYAWGYDNIGSSDNTSSNTYRGTAPFSEPETQAYRDFVNSRHFKTNLSYHTYSNVLIYPFGYEENLLTPDSVLYKEYAALLTKDNRYEFGTVNQTIGYVANGGTFDWLYGEQTSKPKVISFSPEVGSSSDGFWPPQIRIYPLAQENLSANLHLAWLAGAFVKPTAAIVSESTSGDGFFDRGEEIAVQIRFKNMGLDSAGTVSYQIFDLDGNLIPVSQTNGSISGLASRAEALSDTAYFQIATSALPGSSPALIVQYESSGITKSDTLRHFMVIGIPNILFINTAEEGMLGWVPGDWGTTNTTFVSPENSFADSPNGNYPANADNAMITQHTIDLSGLDRVFLEYYSRWDIEKNWDFAQVLIATDGTNWEPLQAPRMRSGSGQGVQTAGEPGYDGTQIDWVKESIDISDFANQPVSLKFQFQSDGFVEADGWYLDDIRILTFSTAVGVVEQGTTENLVFDLMQNYPNPFNPSTTIRYSVPGTERIKLTVYNALGEKVTELVNAIHSPGKYQIEFNAAHLSSGIYFVTMQGQQFKKTQKMLLTR